MVPFYVVQRLWVIHERRSLIENIVFTRPQNFIQHFLAGFRLRQTSLVETGVGVDEFWKLFPKPLAKPFPAFPELLFSFPALNISSISRLISPLWYLLLSSKLLLPSFFTTVIVLSSRTPKSRMIQILLASIKLLWFSCNSIGFWLLDSAGMCCKSISSSFGQSEYKVVFLNVVFWGVTRSFGAFFFQKTWFFSRFWSFFSHF